MGRLHLYIRTFTAARAAVPDGIRWLAPQLLCRTRGAADVLGLANQGLTFLPSLHDCLSNRWCDPPLRRFSSVTEPGYAAIRVGT